MQKVAQRSSAVSILRGFTKNQTVQNHRLQPPARSQRLSRAGWKSLLRRNSSHGSPTADSTGRKLCCSVSRWASSSTCQGHESKQCSATATILMKQYNGGKNWKSRNRKRIYGKGIKGIGTALANPHKDLVLSKPNGLRSLP